jgi:pimeloyl-ACP methyl ester carboxylesterase
MTARSRGLIGVGVGLAAAGLATAAGVATDRFLRARRAEGAAAAPVDGDEPDTSGTIVVAEDGVPLYVEIDECDAPVATVIFTHGYAHNGRLWARQREAVHDAGYRAVTWDLRGHGRSGEGDDSSYTLAQLGRDLSTVVEQTTPDGPLVLVGHSMGGMAIMAFAEERPQLMRERVIGIALISTSAGGLAEVNYGLGKQLGAVVHRLGPAAVSRAARRQDLFDNARMLGRNFESVLVHRYSFGGPVPKAVIREVAEMIFATKLQVIGAFLPSLMEHDRRAVVATFAGIETLILHGTRDRITPIGHAEELADALPGAELVVVEDAGHVLPLEDPELVSRELLAFLSRTARAASGGRAS